MLLIETICLIVCLTYRRKEKIGKIFLLYITFDFFIALLDFFIVPFSNWKQTNTDRFYYFTNELVSALELFVYYFYFLQILQNSKIQQVLKLLRSFFLVIAIFFITTFFVPPLPITIFPSNYFTVIEFIFLLFPCLVYYYELFETDPIHRLFDRPSFWIITGIMFFSLVSIPFYCTAEIYKNKGISYMYVLFYLPFAINFAFLTKGFLCKNKLTI